jgi:hypothetical protein
MSKWQKRLKWRSFCPRNNVNSMQIKYFMPQMNVYAMRGAESPKMCDSGLGIIVNSP